MERGTSGNPFVVAVLGFAVLSATRAFGSPPLSMDVELGAARAEVTITAQMKMKPGMKMEGMATSGIFEGVGKVIAIVPAKGQIVMEHDEIKGFMKKMTMGYPVESKTMLDGLNPGDSIKFKIDAAEKKIIAIERMK